MNWLDQLQKQIEPPSETPPIGFYNARQAAKHWGIEVQNARVRLRRGERMGILKCVTIKQTINGERRNVKFYGPAKAKA